MEIEIVRRTLSFRLLCFSCFWCGALRLLGDFVRIGQFELNGEALDLSSARMRSGCIGEGEFVRRSPGRTASLLMHMT